MGPPCDRARQWAYFLAHTNTRTTVVVTQIPSGRTLPHRGSFARNWASIGVPRAFRGQTKHLKSRRYSMMRTTKTGIRDSPQRDGPSPPHFPRISPPQQINSPPSGRTREGNLQGLVDATTSGEATRHESPRGAAGCLERCSPRGNGSCRNLLLPIGV